MWTNVPKPSVLAWVGVAGRLITYDDPTTLYNATNITYDGSPPNNWNSVAKPATSSWNSVPKPT